MFIRYLLIVWLGVGLGWPPGAAQAAPPTATPATPLTTAPAAPASAVCFATHNNGITVYSSADASAIQSAINVATSGATIKIAGTCAGVQAGGGTTQTVYADISLTLAGGYTTTHWATPDPVAYPTVLDAQGAGRVVRANASLTLRDLTLQNGQIAGDGGGVRAGTSVNWNNVRLVNNTATGNGGGAYLGTLSGGTLIGVTFEGNSATNGGGLYMDVSSGAFLSNTHFLSNTATGNGGGLFSLMPDTVIINSTFVNNRADVSGGMFAGRAATIDNSLFARNSANSGGQAIRLSNNFTYRLRHLTIVSPTVTSGAAVSVNNAAVFITNTLVASHTVGYERASGALTETFTLFSQVAAPYVGTVIQAGGSFTAPAALANHTTYQLSAASPARDAGINAGLMFDFFGVTRPRGAGYDIGYAEFTFPPVCFTEYTGDSLTDFASDDATAVRQAIAAASPGGTVKVAGTCAGAVTEGGSTQVAVINKNLTLAGGYTTTAWHSYNPTANVTVLDAQSGGRVISTTSTAAATLQGFTLRNGWVNTGSSHGFGGGVFAQGPLTLIDMVVRDNLITGTAGSQYGGGVYAISGTVIHNSVFFSNTARFQGGGGFFINTTVISGATFAGNRATTSNGGGAYFFSNTTLTNTTFITNASGAGGAGAMFLGGARALNSAFIGNHTNTSGGGAVFAFTAALTNTRFINNSANASGAGAYFQNPSARHGVNNLFAGNTAPAGAAIDVANATPLSLIHTTLVSPSVAGGSAVRVAGGAVWLTNTIVASHTVGLERSGGTLTETFTLFHAVSAPYAGSVVQAGGSITGHTRFVNHTQYHLGLTSAAVDAGVNAGVLVDYLGIDRPQGSGFDIGYYELPTASVTFRVYLPLILR